MDWLKVISIELASRSVLSEWGSYCANVEVDPFLATNLWFILLTAKFFIGVGGRLTLMLRPRECWVVWMSALRLRMRCVTL